MTPIRRREFLSQSAAAAAAMAAAGTLSTRAVAARTTPLPASATQKVMLGKSGVQVSMVGMGTGSVGVNQSSNQVKLGVKGFTKVVRHALDRGVCLFDVADQYGSHVFLREALKGVPRDQYVIQTKTHAHDATIARSHLERYLPRAGRRPHRHPAAALHDQGRLAARERRGDGVSDEGQGAGPDPRPRHELPRHGPPAHLGAAPVRRGRPGPDQPAGPDHGRQVARRGRQRAPGDARPGRRRHRHEDPRRGPHHHPRGQGRLAPLRPRASAPSTPSSSASRPPTRSTTSSSAPTTPSRHSPAAENLFRTVFVGSIVSHARPEAMRDSLASVHGEFTSAF